LNCKTILITFSFSLLIAACKPTNKELLNEANGWSNQKAYNKAIEKYSIVIKHNSELQLPYYNRGICYLNLQKYREALADFNKIIALQTIGTGFTYTLNADGPLADEKARLQISYYDAIYQRAQTKFYLDSIQSSFRDFQLLVDNNYAEKSNCILWQATLFIRANKTDKACEYFEKAKQFASSTEDRQQADTMLITYCHTKK
jgi:tetratricopeptide (TPR) repeat protein